MPMWVQKSNKKNKKDYTWNSSIECVLVTTTWLNPHKISKCYATQ